MSAMNLVVGQGRVARSFVFKASEAFLFLQVASAAFHAVKGFLHRVPVLIHRQRCPAGKKSSEIRDIVMAEYFRIAFGTTKRLSL